MDINRGFANEPLSTGSYVYGRGHDTAYGTSIHRRFSQRRGHGTPSLHGDHIVSHKDGRRTLGVGNLACAV